MATPYYVAVPFPMVRYDAVTGLPFTVASAAQVAVLPPTFIGAPVTPAAIQAFPAPLIAAVVMPLPPLPAPILAPIVANLETLKPKTKGKS